MKELSVTGFLRKVLEQHRTRPDHPFCWILGAGASVSSGIPTAGTLAREFLARLCEDATRSREDCGAWLNRGELQIEGLDPLDPAKHYPELYERLYGDCPDAGYAFLEDIMRDKRPSYGYAVLALILEKTPHRIVITTNFDNLVADALAAHSTTFPRVVGHAQLTQFVQTDGRRPLVAKIHGDLGFQLRNTPKEIEKLDTAWQDPLERIFRRCTPIVIGYGGNDRTLMELLRLLPVDIPDRIYWCQWEREQPAAHVSEFLAQKKGARLVRHPGFDALMLQLEVKLRENSGLDLPLDLVSHLKRRQAEQLASFREQRESLGKVIASAEHSTNPRQSENPAEAQERQALAGAAAQALVGGSAPGDRAKAWWAWGLEALAAPTSDARDKVYRAAVNERPREPRLLGTYANFLYDERRDVDRAEEFYKRAIDADPKHANNLGDYALFLCRENRDLDLAEELYNRAIDADPKNANNLGNYALLLHREHRDVDRAEALYKRAIDADPKHANNLANYASFLCDERRDLDRTEEFYKRAIDADPKHANSLGGYALFLHSGRRDLDHAEEFYKRAIDADPKNAINLGNYARFLHSDRRDLDHAEEFYKRAIDADPKHATNLRNYARFLHNEQRDVDRAEEFYKRAIDADPKDATNLGSYARFLHNERRDVDRAEEFYKRAIDANPKSAINLGNYALLLHSERRDLDHAGEFYRRAIDADSKHAINLGNYARFLCDERHDLDGAEEFYKRAIDADSKHAINLGNYALFLCNERRDLDGAEEFYRRAIDADPKHATNLGNHAHLLLANGRRPEGTERLAEAFVGSGMTGSLLSELWFYAYAHAGDLWPDALGRLKGALQAGDRSEGWDLSDNVSRAQADGHAESALVATLADVITGRAEIATLDKFSTWRNAKAIPPDSPALKAGCSAPGVVPDSGLAAAPGWIDDSRPEKSAP